VTKPRKISDINELLPILMTIGMVKRSLPLQLRDWINILGLYVQFHSGDGWEGLAAGGKYRSYFEALNPDTSNTDAFFGKADAWKIRKFDKKVWDNRFAHLVLPTSDVAIFISGGNPYHEAGSQFNQQASATLMQVVRHFEATGEWLSLPSNRVCVTCGREPTIEQWEGEFCPYCGISFHIEGNRSCEHCRYGPDFFACLKGETGKPVSPEPFVFNPFGTSPTKYHLSNSRQMFCFQPRNNRESSPDAMTPMD
jgi:hypothetical protein